MALLIRGGTVVTAADTFDADVYCEAGRIAAVGRHLTPPPGGDGSAPLTLDAAGKYVFPGFVDPHVHVTLPFMGAHAKDGWASASRAALAGGTTTLIEMICPARQQEPLDAYGHWAEQARGKALCDYRFHMGVTRFDDRARAQLREIVLEHGVRSFKVFLAYKGALDLTDAELYGVCRLAAELGVVVTAHCENADLVAARQGELVAADQLGPEFHEPSRPVGVEAEGTARLMRFAELTGARVYVVHLSCVEALEEVRAARRRGVDAWCEAVLPHLVLDKSYAERTAPQFHRFEGAKYVMSPPLREPRHQDALWAGLADRSIATVGTDHAPFDFVGQKDMGDPEAGGNFTTIPNGIPSVEHRVELLYTHGVAAGRIDLQTMVDAAATQPARLFGLYPQKGTIAPGADADLVIFDPAATRTISARTHHMNVDYSAFEGWQTRGRVETTIIAGRVFDPGKA